MGRLIAGETPLYMIINSVSLQSSITFKLQKGPWCVKYEESQSLKVGESDHMQSVPDFLEEQFYIQVSDVTSQLHFLAQVPGLPHLQIGSPPPPLLYFYNEDPNTMIKTATNRI